MHCLWCDTTIMPEISWKTIIWLPKPKRLCASCEDTLMILQGKRCSKCSRVSDSDRCPDCTWLERRTTQEDSLICNYSVFAYNEAIKEMVARWKYRGDYCLAEAFQRDYRQAFDREFSFLPGKTAVVPIPLSGQRMDERGFNQAQRLADFLPLPTLDILTRSHREKQSKKSRRERLEADNPFRMTGSINNPVLLADDIYTTGTTLRRAASVLKKHGCPAVYALTLIRG
ncbi:ComF family protein [Lentibacillus salinarum]|uniref:ComF family protein n=1 Tax=Lentibacillus salinarum TaxID=446820 RepID=A0ABW3ZTG7_9BACI